MVAAQDGMVLRTRNNTEGLCVRERVSLIHTEIAGGHAILRGSNGGNKGNEMGHECLTVAR